LASNENSQRNRKELAASIKKTAMAITGPKVISSEMSSAHLPKAIADGNVQARLIEGRQSYSLRYLFQAALIDSKKLISEYRDQFQS
jgi:hypothetical protein